MQDVRTPSEQMYFGGAPLAHVVLYYEIQRKRRWARSRAYTTIRQHDQLIRCLAERFDKPETIPRPTAIAEAVD